VALESFDYFASIAPRTGDSRMDSAVRDAYQAVAALNADCLRPAALGPQYVMRRSGLRAAS
jgi:hypothetical protein